MECLCVYECVGGGCGYVCVCVCVCVVCLCSVFVCMHAQ